MSVYPNIEMYIAIRGIKKRTIATSLGITEKSFRNKLAGKSEFTYSQAITLKNTFFPDLTLEELFSKNAMQVVN